MTSYHPWIAVRKEAWGQQRSSPWPLASMASEVETEAAVEEATEEVVETAGRWQAPADEITRRRNFAIISHPVSNPALLKVE